MELLHSLIRGGGVINLCIGGGSVKREHSFQTSLIDLLEIFEDGVNKIFGDLLLKCRLTEEAFVLFVRDEG